MHVIRTAYGRVTSLSAVSFLNFCGRLRNGWTNNIDRAKRYSPNRWPCDYFILLKSKDGTILGILAKISKPIHINKPKN